MKHKVLKNILFLLGLVVVNHKPFAKVIEPHTAKPPLALNALSPEFTLPLFNRSVTLLSGRDSNAETLSPVSLSEFAGKVVYIDFWASWCAPCLRSFPVLNQMYKDYRHKGFEIIAINMDENLSNAQAFLTEHPIDYTVLQGYNHNVANQYQIHGLPSAFLVDASGKLRLIHTGFKRNDARFLRANIEKLLAEKAVLE